MERQRLVADRPILLAVKYPTVTQKRKAKPEPAIPRFMFVPRRTDLIKPDSNVRDSAVAFSIIYVTVA